jgi:hypothetical protein
MALAALAPSVRPVAWRRKERRLCRSCVVMAVRLAGVIFAR